MSSTHYLPLREQAGYLEHREYSPSGSDIVIYIAKEQCIDVGGARYTVVCTDHGTLGSESTRAHARASMTSPEFCEQCMQHHGSPT